MTGTSKHNNNSVKKKIDTEVNYYSQLAFTETENRKQKNLKLIVLDWWKAQQKQFLSLYQAAKGLLHTPATSVPSERIFSEAGYIARARRSKILPVNLNKHLFIKKNMDYVPLDVDNFTQEFAKLSLEKK